MSGRFILLESICLSVLGRGRPPNTVIVFGSAACCGMDMNVRHIDTVIIVALNMKSLGCEKLVTKTMDS